MQVVIRCDASVNIGTGHIMRCLTLADELREKGSKVSFICCQLPDNLTEIIRNKGYKFYSLSYNSKLFCISDSKTSVYAWRTGVDYQTDAEQTRDILLEEHQEIDWLVVDHYALEQHWEKFLRPYVKRIMVIDDLADRPHDCDLLLDQNLYDNMALRYNGLVPKNCVTLLGPYYALLRREFKQARQTLRWRNGSIKRILISFGGTDPTNETAKALEAIKLLNCSKIITDVVVGSVNLYRDEIGKKCLSIPGVNYHCQVGNMAELMAKADLSIGAGGSTSWERCCLGLPAIVSILADNQHELANSLVREEVIINLGRSENISKINYLETIRGFSVLQLQQMGKRGLDLVDGEGGSRVIKKMISISSE